MAGTYSQIYLHLVFAVKHREYLISKTWKNRLYAYLASIIKEKGSKPIIINGMPDHVHIFIGYRPSTALPELVRELKNNSSKFINEQKLVPGKFAWQEGYGAFSYGQSQIDTVYKYIENQELHHQKITFKAEYLQLLKKFEIEFNEKYLFHWDD